MFQSIINTPAFRYFRSEIWNNDHTVATAQRMIHQLKIYSAAIIRLQVQAIQLTMKFDNREKEQELHNLHKQAVELELGLEVDLQGLLRL